MQFEKKTLPDSHYLYVDRECGFTGPEISAAMGSGFGEVFGFATQQGITPQTMPMTMYMDMPSGGTMKFRAGVFVSEADAKKASGAVKADIVPAGHVVTTTHVGPYASLNQSHKALWDHCDSAGYNKKMPVWEVYIDDPTTVPEAQVRTEIYRAVS